MEKDFGSWLLHRQLDRQSPYLDFSVTPANLGQQNALPAYMSPCANVVPSNGALPWVSYHGIPHSRAIHPNEPNGRFYSLPRFQPVFNPLPNSILKEKIPTGPLENCNVVVAPNPQSGCAPKRFVVVDQSGGKTTLIFSSGIGNPTCGRTSWGRTLDNACDLNKIELGTGGCMTHLPGPVLIDECNGNQRDDVDSEMHEDTEELNALLYSDDEYDSSDDEEVSTGHSPSTMTAHDKQELFGEFDEVASSGGPSKRMKLIDGGCMLPSLLDTACSVKPQRSFDYEDNTASSGGDSKNECPGEFASLSGNKRSRTDKIRETLSILQKIVPGGKGKDGMVIIDEAINYLISLKHKAKALGVETF